MLNSDSTAIQIMDAIDAIFDRHTSLSPDPLIAEFEEIARKVGPEMALKCLLMAHAVSAIRLRSETARPR